jgi:hypothetical protein
VQKKYCYLCVLSNILIILKNTFVFIFIPCFDFGGNIFVYRKQKVRVAVMIESGL